MSMAFIRLSTLTMLPSPTGYSKRGWEMALADVMPTLVADLPVNEPTEAIAWPDMDCALVPYRDEYAALGANQEYDPNAKTFTVTANEVVGLIPAVNISPAVLLGASDYKMARGFEDIVPALIAAGIAIPAPVLDNINARRALRGEPPIGG